MGNYNSKIIIIAGSNRTGTSLLTQILIKKGFQVPLPIAKSGEYNEYENEQFQNISKRWCWQDAKLFVKNLKGDKIVLKYPKASFVLDKWLTLIPHAKVIYVFRPIEEAVTSQVNNWWPYKRLLSFLGRWIYSYEWLRGYLAMRNIAGSSCCFVTFEELKYTKNFRPPACWGWNDDDQIYPYNS